MVIYTGDYSRLVYYPRSNEQKDVVIDREIREIGDFAFSGAALQSLRLPRSLEKIGIAAFFGSSLDQLEVPDSVVSIGQLCFSLCREMRKLTIPAGVTEIGSSLFRYDDSLTVYVQSGSYAENYMKYGLYLDNYSTARISYEIGT